MITNFSVHVSAQAHALNLERKLLVCGSFDGIQRGRKLTVCVTFLVDSREWNDILAIHAELKQRLGLDHRFRIGTREELERTSTQASAPSLATSSFAHDLINTRGRNTK